MADTKKNEESPSPLDDWIMADDKSTMRQEFTLGDPDKAKRLIRRAALYSAKFEVPVTIEFDAASGVAITLPVNENIPDENLRFFTHKMSAILSTL